MVQATDSRLSVIHHRFVPATLMILIWNTSQSADKQNFKFFNQSNFIAHKSYIIYTKFYHNRNRSNSNCTLPQSEGDTVQPCSVWPYYEVLVGPAFLKPFPWTMSLLYSSLITFKCSLYVCGVAGLNPGKIC